MKKLNLKLILSLLVFVCFAAGIFVRQATEQVAQQLLQRCLTQATN